MMWRNTHTGTIYSRWRSPAGPGFTWVRSARTGKLTRVLTEHLEEYIPDDDRTLDGTDPAPPSIDDALAGEPVEDPGEPDHLGLVAAGVEDPWAEEFLAPPPAPPVDVQLPRLPAIHGDLRNLSYNVGSAVALLVEEPENLDVLRVAILMLGDEVDRIRNGR